MKRFAFVVAVIVFVISIIGVVTVVSMSSDLSKEENATAIYKSPQGQQQIAKLYQELLAQWPVTNHRKRLNTVAGETFVIECGTESKPALVLLHGSMGNSASWMMDVSVWAPHFHIYVVDVIGEPGFSAPSRPALDSDAYANWLDDVLNQLGIQQATVVGISLGGWFSLDYAIRRPDRVNNLVLISPGGVGAQRNILYWVVPLSLMGQWGKNKVRELMIGKPPQQITPTMAKFGELSALISRYFRPRLEALPIFSDQQLASLNMPVMAVVAGKDLMLDAWVIKQRLENNVSNLELRYLSEARHFPGSQAEPIKNFLKKNARK